VHRYHKKINQEELLKEVEILDSQMKAEGFSRLII
jgi:hypothetical protein